MNKIPNFQDEVRHRRQDIIGVVITKYPAPKKKTSTQLQKKLNKNCPERYLFDVRTNTDRIIYATPAENWETLRTEEERTW